MEQASVTESPGPRVARQVKIALVRVKARRIEYPGVVLSMRRVKKGSIFIDRDVSIIS